MAISTRTRTPRFWVVSPNVTRNERAIDLWKEAIRHRHVAFMGYGPNDPNHRLGIKFAYEISKGDVILIARRKNREPDVVGFGIVSEDQSIQQLRGFTPPDEKWRTGSIRRLTKFNGDPKVPSGLNIVSVLNHRQSLCQLHPRWSTRPHHRRVCDWLSKELGLPSGRSGTQDDLPSKPTKISAVRLSRLLAPRRPEYTCRTSAEVRIAIMREAELVVGYRDWLQTQKQYDVWVASYQGRRCDAYEEKRNNLIEAKSSNNREYIRMAVGQLLDYAYLGKEKFGTPHMAILLPKEPPADVKDWLQGLKIGVVWKDGKKFKDNAHGQFT